MDSKYWISHVNQKVNSIILFAVSNMSWTSVFPNRYIYIYTDDAWNIYTTRLQEGNEPKSEYVSAIAKNIQLKTVKLQLIL